MDRVIPRAFAGGARDGQLLVEDPAEVDDGEQHEEQHRDDEGELDRGRTVFEPMSGHRSTPFIDESRFDRARESTRSKRSTPAGEPAHC